jgi:hypothetical protein
MLLFILHVGVMLLLLLLGIHMALFLSAHLHILFLLQFRVHLLYLNSRELTGRLESLLLLLFLFLAWLIAIKSEIVEGRFLILEKFVWRLLLTHSIINVFY